MQFPPGLFCIQLVLSAVNIPRERKNVLLWGKLSPFETAKRCRAGNLLEEPGAVVPEESSQRLGRAKER